MTPSSLLSHPAAWSAGSTPITGGAGDWSPIHAESMSGLALPADVTDMSGSYEIVNFVGICRVDNFSDNREGDASEQPICAVTRLTTS